MRFSKFQNDYSSLKTVRYPLYMIRFLAGILSFCLKMQAAILLCLRHFIGGFQIKRHKIMRIGHECGLYAGYQKKLHINMQLYFLF
jgi:hypothetical protein